METLSFEKIKRKEFAVSNEVMMSAIMMGIKQNIIEHSIVTEVSNGAGRCETVYERKGCCDHENQLIHNFLQQNRKAILLNFIVDPECNQYIQMIDLKLYLINLILASNYSEVDKTDLLIWLKSLENPFELSCAFPYLSVRSEGLANGPLYIKLL